MFRISYVFRQLKSVRPFVWGLIMYICLLLFQTDYRGLGTVSALLVIGFTILSVVLYRKKSEIKDEHFSKPLLFFVFFVVLMIFVSGFTPHYLFRFLAQIILFLFLCRYSITDYENEVIKTALCIVMSLYGILTIDSIVNNPISTNYIHGGVLLFNTELDPNCISIPFVAASTISLGRLLKKQQIVFSVLSLGISLLTLLYLASRGAMVAILVSVVLNMVVNKGYRPRMLIRILILVFLVYLLFRTYLSSVLLQNIERVTDFGVEDDNGRFELWSHAYELWKESPILGIGLGGVVSHIGHGSHNLFVELLAETGALGLILFVVFSLRVIKNAYKHSKDLFVLVIGCFVQSLFVGVLGDRSFWVFLIWCSMLGSNTNISMANARSN